MNDFVAMEQNVCQICGNTHEHNTGILINKRLKEIPEDKRITGYGLCKRCDDLTEEYIALVAIDPDKSVMKSNGNVDPEGVYRTGDIAHIRRSKVNEVFNIELDATLPFICVEQEVINQLNQG